MLTSPVPSLYCEPVLYGISDVSIPDGSGSFHARIYHPRFGGSVYDVAIRPGM
ncbi:hypothetical protein BH24ACT7_BH24ACT7_18630 [soil metagenome]